jgi:hypothetical protein
MNYLLVLTPFCSGASRQIVLNPLLAYRPFRLEPEERAAIIGVN